MLRKQSKKRGHSRQKREKGAGPYTSKTSKKMDHVETHLRREQAQTGSEKVSCRHPVCEAAGLVLHVQVDTSCHIKSTDPHRSSRS
jgi:hypothetical protein